MLDRSTQEASLGEIVSRVVDNGKEYVRAEIAVAKASVTSKVAAIKPAAILLVVALLLVQAALTVLTAALGMGLTHWLGTAGGLAVGGIIVLAVAGLLAWIAIARVQRAFA